MRNYIGQYVLVRSDRAGLFAGVLEEQEGQRVVLKDARRLWYWEGACSPSQIAMEGVKRPEGCKFAIPVDELMLFDAIEIIPMPKQAEKNIKDVPIWKS